MSNTTNGGAVAKRSDRMGTVLGMLEKSKGEIQRALPKHITPDRMLRVAITSLRTNPALLNCEPLSIVKAVMQAAQLGLETDGVLGHAYLVPYGKECQLLPGYRGLVELCRRSGAISTITAEVVYEGDEFDFMLGDNPFIKHRPALDQDRTQRDVTHVYAIARLKDGGVERRVMTKHDIDAHARKYSRAINSNDSPWKTAWDWMAKKTVLRQLMKLLPVSIEVQRLMQTDEYATEGVLQTEPTDPQREPPSSLDDLADRLSGPQQGSVESPADDADDTGAVEGVSEAESYAAYKSWQKKLERHTSEDLLRQTLEESATDQRLTDDQRMLLEADVEDKIGAMT